MTADDETREAVASIIEPALWKVDENDLTLKEIFALRNDTADRIIERMQALGWLDQQTATAMVNKAADIVREQERDALRAQLEALTLPTDRAFYVQYFPHRGYRVQVLPNGREWCVTKKQTEFDSIGRSGFHSMIQDAYQAALAAARDAAKEAK